MNFNDHSSLVGLHATLSASKYHWLNYDPERMAEVYRNSMAAQKGTALHNFAQQAINLGVKLPRSNRTLNMFVNDAIGYRMTPEQVLFYSVNCFGTADAISFKNGLLRIHDLKTGVTPSSMKQLEIYAALFCLEYRTRPQEIQMELRIYQDDEIEVHTPEAEAIDFVIGKIITFDKLIEQLKIEESV